MNRLSKHFKLALLVLFALIVFGGLNAYTAANTISTSHLDQFNSSASPNDLKPVACMNISIDNLISIADGDTPTNRSDLIIGTPSRDIIDGLSREDCILAGDGDDEIHGGSGSDVILGGSGADTLYGDAGGDLLNGGDGFDECIGGGGNDHYIDCEITR